MAEYIERDAVCSDCKNQKVCVDKSVCPVGRAPAADVEVVKHGRWVLGYIPAGYFTPGGNRPWVCSECGRAISWMLGKPMEKYCPNCGCKMDLEVTNGQV